MGFTYHTISFMLLIGLVDVAIAGIIIMISARRLKTQSIIFMVLTVYALLITYLSQSSIPDNLFVLQAIAVALGVLAIIAFILRFLIRKHYNLAQSLLVTSIATGIIYMFI